MTIELEFGPDAPSMHEQLCVEGQPAFSRRDVASYAQDMADATQTLIDGGVITEFQASLIRQWLSDEVERRLQPAAVA